MKERPLNRIWRDANQFFRSHMKEACMSCPYSRSPIFQALSVLTLGLCSSLAAAATVHNPVCPVESVLYNPGSGEDIVVPTGYQVSVFAKDLNFPTAVAFKGNKQKFEVYVLESGHGLPSR